ncbi:hypothetical protein HELRODRAFT_157714 [Helobdella robusta]|uniref:Sidoreflexin n=1 Tax=Helobdella robusta TaxID=6412 RepID=T1EME6_HELRO|nr:hypothetical protein HELRODRAFT_157714 [Helobdella robusta]ESN95174.1 hypothetical protein HELRODRAFT_157714 [Helobdella robusta]
MATLDPKQRVNIDEPRYDQNTYFGRAKHFFITTNPLNLFVSDTELEKSRKLVQLYRQGKEPEGLTLNELWRAKNIYDSAFHPDTGEKMILIGRMSAQVPMNMTIVGCMMTFYKSTPAVIFWQWFNQSFNAVVNYTNRSGDSPISIKTLLVSYVAATGGALSAALFFNKAVKTMHPLVGRYVPFIAVASSNAINIPCMRNRELFEGIPVLTEDGERVGESKAAARKAIIQVTLSRILMASPGMIFPPLLMARLDKTLLKKYPMLAAPIQIGLCLVFATPMFCALFPQKSSISVDKVEDEIRERLRGREGVKYLYFNKGL